MPAEQTLVLAALSKFTRAVRYVSYKASHGTLFAPHLLT